MLIYLVEVKKIDPCQTRDNLTIQLPITGAAISGSWECFRYLFAYYQKSDAIDKDLEDVKKLIPRLAIQHNHISFLMKFVAIYGRSYLKGRDSRNISFEDSVLVSGHFHTVQVIKSYFSLDFSRQDGYDNSLLWAANYASEGLHYHNIWKVIADILTHYSSEFNAPLTKLVNKSGQTLAQIFEQCDYGYLIDHLADSNQNSNN